MPTATTLVMRMRRDPGCPGHMSPGHGLPFLTNFCALWHFPGHSRAIPRVQTASCCCPAQGGSRGGGSRGQLLPSPTSSAPTATSSCAGPRLPPCSLISVIGGGDPAAPFRCSRPVDVAVERRVGGTARRGHGSPTRHPTGLIPAQLPQSLTGLGKGVVR